MKSRHTIVLIAAIIAVVIIIALILKPNKMNQNGDYVLDVSDIEVTPVTSTNESRFDVIAPVDWSEIERAQRIINETQGKDIDQEEITHGVIQDPIDSDVYYFATYDNGSRDNGTRAVDDRFLGIYRYQTSDHNWERIYKETYVVDEPGDPSHQFLVLGYDAGRLIVKRSQQFTEFEACYDPLIAETELNLFGEEVDSPLLSLNLLAPYDGLDEYSLWSEVRYRHEETQKECQEQL